MKLVVNPLREKDSAHEDSAAACALLISWVSANVTKNELGEALIALYAVNVLTSAMNHVAFDPTFTPPVTISLPNILPTSLLPNLDTSSVNNLDIAFSQNSFSKLFITISLKTDFSTI